MKLNDLSKQEVGELIAGIHSLGKDRLRELILELWALFEANEPPELSDATRVFLHSWLDGAADDARHHEPDVGIFGNDDIANEVETFMLWLEG